jgi:hypothetical protein
VRNTVDAPVFGDDICAFWITACKFALRIRGKFGLPFTINSSIARFIFVGIGSGKFGPMSCSNPWQQRIKAPDSFTALYYSHEGNSYSDRIKATIIEQCEEGMWGKGNSGTAISQMWSINTKWWREYCRIFVNAGDCEELKATVQNEPIVVFNWRNCAQVRKTILWLESSNSILVTTDSS